jgi:hypothetical protein
MKLLLSAALYGAIAALIFRRFTNAARLRTIVNHVLAHVMEFALFIDEPSLILKAQIDLIKANFQLLRQIALPCVIMAIPFVLLYPAMDRNFGVRTGNVLTLPIGQPLPAGVIPETPGVRVLRTHEVSWRIRTDHNPGPNILARHWVIWFALISMVTAAAAAGTRRPPA